MKWWEGIVCLSNTIETERDDSRGRDGWSNQFSLSFIMLAFSTVRHETIYLIAEFYEPDFELFGVEN